METLSVLVAGGNDRVDRQMPCHQERIRWIPVSQGYGFAHVL